MKGVYLFACKARHKNYNLDYNDIVPIYNCDLICDAMQVDLSNYDSVLQVHLVIIGQKQILIIALQNILWKRSIYYLI